MPPTVSTRPASITDVFPSLLVLCGYSGELPGFSYFQGQSLFNADRRVVTGERGDFLVKISTIVGSAWKMQRATPDPFGYHTGVISAAGKLIREEEETGTRFFYFAHPDRIETRTEIDLKDPDLPAEVKRLLPLLPEGPKL